MEQQISMFETVEAPKSELFEILKRGSTENAALRIYAAYMTLDGERFAEFLADEYGIGGHSIPGGFVDYNGKGMIIRYWNRENVFPARMDQKYTWKQIAKAYAQMIQEGLFPDAEVLQLYEEARKAGKGAPAPGIHYWGRGDR